MEAVKITVQNLSTVLTEAQAEKIVAALSTQLTTDYNGSYWVTQELAAPVDSVTLLGKGEAIPLDSWHMELLDTSDQEGALGYHDDEVFKRHTRKGKPEKHSSNSERGLRADAPQRPLMRVFAKTSEENGTDPAEVASHEGLEALVDPQVVNENKIRKVHNHTKKQLVLVEVGDPVQSNGYTVGEVTVADFCLPAFFGYPQDADPTRMSFRGSVTEPFQIAPKGYMSVAPESDPQDWKQEMGSAM